MKRLKSQNQKSLIDTFNNFYEMLFNYNLDLNF